MLRNTHLYKVLYSQTLKFCFRSTFKNRIDCTIVSKNWNFCGSLCLELALTPYSFIFCCINAFLAIGAKLISFRSVSIVNTSKAADLLVPLFDSTSIVLRKFRNVHSWSGGKTWINIERCVILKYVSRFCLFVNLCHLIIVFLHQNCKLWLRQGSSNFHHDIITLDDQVHHKL